MPALPSDYERRALREIERWRNPPPHWLRTTINGFNAAWHEVTDLVRKVPGVDWTIENVVSGLLQLTNEITQDSVWTDAIYKEYQAAGHPIESPDDIYRLDLSDIDDVLRDLDTKYRAVAAVEGAATGFAGAAGIMPDIIALVTINLRAAGEYATYCGFDLRRPEERLFALTMLDYVARPSNKAKNLTMTPLTSIATRVAQQQSVQAAEQFGLSQAIERAAKALGLRLTGAKLAQVVPVAGAAVGSGYNAYYTSKVCDAAFYLYRERYLMEKYGKEVPE